MLKQSIQSANEHCLGGRSVTANADIVPMATDNITAAATATAAVCRGACLGTCS
jgi:hypothetical protein